MLLEDKKKQDVTSSSIYEDMTLYKVLKTNRDRTVCVHFDGSISVIIPFQGINNTSMTEETFVQMFERIKSSIDDIDNNLITLSFTMVRDSNIGVEDVSVLPSFLQPRALFLNSLADNYMLFKNKFYLTVHCRAVSEIQEGRLKKIYNNYIKKNKDATSVFDKAMEGIELRLIKMNEVMDIMLDLMNDIGCIPSVIKTVEEYYNIIQEFTRPNKNKIQKVEVDNNDMNFPPRQQLFSGVRAEISKKSFVLDDYYHKVFTLDRSPRRMIFGKSIEILESFPAEFIYSVTFRTVSHQDSTKKFQYKLAEARLKEGGNEDALVENRSLQADLRRVSESYDRFAFGDSVGIEASCNFILRIKESFIDKMIRMKKMSRDEILREYDNNLMKNVFAKFGLSEWVNEQNTQWRVFNSCIPGMANIHHYENFKKLFLTSDNIPYFLPIYDTRRNHVKHNGTNHFVDMSGNRVDVDIMDSSLPAWNYSFSGQTGSGKSVLVNAFLTMQFSEMIMKGGSKPVICILDVGGDRGSYMKFMRLVKGTQINLSRSQKPAIQMFELVPDRSLPKPSKITEIAQFILEESKEHNKEYQLSELEKLTYEYYYAKQDLTPEELADPNKMKKVFAEVFDFPSKPEYTEKLKLKPGECMPDVKKVNVIMAVLEIILSSTPKQIDGFNQYDADEILEIVQETYRRIDGRFPYMSDLLAVAETMVDQNESNARKLLIKLKNYTREGTYGMFDRDSTIDISNDVILADLKGLEAEPNLQAIYTLLISQIFNDKMYFIRNRKKLIIRDEAWSLMKNERARKYFVEDLRTARKNGFATFAVSQLPTDYMYPDPQDGRAIINNMQVNVFCKFDTASICQEIGQEYRLSQEMIDQMTNLGVQKDRQGNPTHSRFMMLIGKQVYILNNYLHPFEYQLYSSSAEDNAIIDYYLQEVKLYDDLESVLWHIAEKKHIGDKGLIDYLNKSGATNMADRISKKND